MWKPFPRATRVTSGRCGRNGYVKSTASDPGADCHFGGPIQGETKTWNRFQEASGVSDWSLAPTSERKISLFLKKKRTNSNHVPRIGTKTAGPRHGIKDRRRGDMMFCLMTQRTRMLSGLPLTWRFQTFITDRTNFVTLIPFPIKSRVTSCRFQMTIWWNCRNRILRTLI